MKIDLKGWQCELWVKKGGKETLCFSVDRDGNVTQHMDNQKWDACANQMMDNAGQIMSRYYSGQQL